VPANLCAVLEDLHVRVDFRYGHHLELAFALIGEGGTGHGDA
jgi:hypothetical protein